MATFLNCSLILSYCRVIFERKATDVFTSVCMRTICVCLWTHTASYKHTITLTHNRKVDALYINSAKSPDCDHCYWGRALAFHSHAVVSNYTSTKMFETHKTMHSQTACVVIWCLWSDVLPVTSPCCSGRSGWGKRNIQFPAAEWATYNHHNGLCFITKLCEVLQEKWNANRPTNWSGHASWFPLG